MMLRPNSNPGVHSNPPSPYLTKGRVRKSTAAVLSSLVPSVPCHSAPTTDTVTLSAVAVSAAAVGASLAQAVTHDAVAARVGETLAASAINDAMVSVQEGAPASVEQGGQPGPKADRVSPPPRVLFLDVDGVLHPLRVLAPTPHTTQALA